MNRDEFELALAIVYDDIEPVATPELMAIRDSILAEFDHLTAEIARLRDAGRWIPVTERMPSDGLHVEIVLDTTVRNVSHGIHESFEEGAQWLDLFIGDFVRVIYWRPPPEPPIENAEVPHVRLHPNHQQRTRET